MTDDREDPERPVLAEAMFRAERLRVYHMAVELQERLEKWMPRLYRIKKDMADHLERAIDSVVLNLAEGATEFSLREKRRFYRMALRSGGEGAAALGFFVRRIPELREERQLLSAIVAMTTGLCRMQRTVDPPNS